MTSPAETYPTALAAAFAEAGIDPDAPTRDAIDAAVDSIADTSTRPAPVRHRLDGATPVGKTITACVADGEEALATTSTMGLLTAAYALTHRIQDAARNHGDRTADLRSQRDLITAEVLRRTGGR